MPTYTVPATHDLLTDDAKALGGAFVDYVELAEDLLRLAGTTFTGAAQSRAIRAIVRQVNHLVRLDGENAGAGLLVSEREGDQSRTYARGARSLTLDPIAEKLIAELGIDLEERRQPSTVAEARFRSVYPVG